MATTVVNPAAVDQETLIKQAVDAHFKDIEEARRLAAGGLPQPTQAQPIVLNVGGQERTFADPTQAAAAFQQLQQERDAALRQAQEAAAYVQPQPQQASTEAAKPAVDMEKYLDLLSKDPIAAADYVDQIRYGYNPVQTNQAALVKLIQVDRFQQSELFKSMNNDYEESNENASAIQTVMQRNNYPWTAETLQAAWQIAKANGLAKLTPVEETQQTQVPQNQYYAPSIGRGSGTYQEAIPDVISQAEKMSADELGALIQRLEKSGVR